MGAAWNAGCGSGSCGDASGKEEMISLTPLHHVQIRGVDGEYLTFYSIVTFIVFTGMTARCLVTDSCLTVLPVSCV